MIRYGVPKTRYGAPEIRYGAPKIRYGSLFSPHRSSSRKAGRTVGSRHPRREALDLRTMSIFIFTVCHTVCYTAGLFIYLSADILSHLLLIIPLTLIGAAARPREL